MIFLFLLGCLAFACFWIWACSQLAANKGRNIELWGVLGALTGPVGLIILAILPAIPWEGEEDDMGPNTPELIEQLADLHQRGILTDAEFEAKKQELLARI